MREKWREFVLYNKTFLTFMAQNRRRKNLLEETRISICRKYDNGKSATIIAKELDLPRTTINNVIKIYKDSSRIESVKIKVGRPRIATIDIKRFILDKINEDVSVTLGALKALIASTYFTTLSISTIDRAISEFNYSFKRIQTVPVARNTESAKDKRFEYCYSFLSLDDERVVFLDEFGVNCSMRCKYGRSLVGTAPRKIVTTIRSKNYSVCAAIKKNSILNFKVLNGSYNSERFCVYVRELIAYLEDGGTKYTIIMDNCSIHKVQNVRAIINQAGHDLVFLPPYSPQLNPIEETFSKWKNCVRASNSLNAEELLVSIQNGHLSINASDCTSFFNHSRSYALKGIGREDF